jgi:hypothetical protein
LEKVPGFGDPLSFLKMIRDVPDSGANPSPSFKAIASNQGHDARSPVQRWVVLEGH